MRGIAEEIELIQTGADYPEQYDAIYDGAVVGHLRLRWGCFTVNYPTHAGELIHRAFPAGDGSFEASERDGHLRDARLAIAGKINVVVEKT